MLSLATIVAASIVPSAVNAFVVCASLGALGFLAYAVYQETPQRMEKAEATVSSRSVSSER
jgi:uncharacterized membrane protein YebE (DUF533 family)